MMEDSGLLRVDGAVDRPLALTFADLAAFPDSEQIPDVSQFQPQRRGGGVTLEALLQRANPKPEADYLTLHADRDDFHVSIPLAATRGEGLIVYHDGPHPLTNAQGGPFRFLIRNPAACHTDELDDCANVKYLDRIELTIRRGRDTRPADESAHAALHAKQGSPG